MEQSVHWTRAILRLVNVPANHRLKVVNVLNAKMERLTFLVQVSLDVKIADAILVARQMKSVIRKQGNADAIPAFLEEHALFL